MLNLALLYEVYACFQNRQSSLISHLCMQHRVRHLKNLWVTIKLMGLGLYNGYTVAAGNPEN